jgi:hypothetical protein
MARFIADDIMPIAAIRAHVLLTFFFVSKPNSNVTAILLDASLTLSFHEFSRPSVGFQLFRIFTSDS